MHCSQLQVKKKKKSAPSRRGLLQSDLVARGEDHDEIKPGAGSTPQA
jgi:hypothetical protein